MSAASSIQALRARLARGEFTHLEWLRDVIARSHASPSRSVFVSFDEEAALAAAKLADTPRGDPAHHPLRGLPVSIKDLFDVNGEVTAGGSKVRAHGPKATRDATVIQRLRATGCVLAGRTTMTEFAFSAVGINPHHGTPRNPADPLTHRIPGGSSSGAAVSVALGLAVAGLGSDTGGSLRIPAALCGLVGFKPTQHRVPRDGVLPLSLTLDSVGAITSCVQDAVTLDAVLADAPALDVTPRSLCGARLAVPQTLMLDGLEAAVARAFDRALARLRDAGATLVPLALEELAEIAAINAPGGLSAIEAYLAHREVFESQREALDPRVAHRIAMGQGVTRNEHQRILAARLDWIGRIAQRLQGVDALVAPTVPFVAPPLQPLLDSDEAFFKTNVLLLRNTFAVNFLDGCAISLPCHAAGELPVGFMIAGTQGQDAKVLGLALAVERCFAGLRG